MREHIEHNCKEVKRRLKRIGGVGSRIEIVSVRHIEVSQQLKVFEAIYAMQGMSAFTVRSVDPNLLIRDSKRIIDALAILERISPMAQSKCH